VLRGNRAGDADERRGCRDGDDGEVTTFNDNASGFDDGDEDNATGFDDVKLTVEFDVGLEFGEVDDDDDMCNRLTSDSSLLKLTTIVCCK
jgi:hypothetical protein